MGLVRYSQSFQMCRILAVISCHLLVLLVYLGGTKCEGIAIIFLLVRQGKKPCEVFTCPLVSHRQRFEGRLHFGIILDIGVYQLNVYIS